MPLQPDKYSDRRAWLTEEETVLLSTYLTRTMSGLGTKRLLEQLARVEAPFLDTVRLTVTRKDQIATARRHLFRAMVERQCTFWGWSHEEWIAVIEAAPSGRHAAGTRFWLLNLAYLLCDLLYIGAATTYGLMADAIFGKALVDEQAALAHAPLVAAGFSTEYTEWRHFRWVCAFALLVNRSPYIHALTAASMQTVRDRVSEIPGTGGQYGRRMLVHLQAALTRLGVLERPALVPTARPPYPRGLRGADPTVDPRWLSWVRSYYDQTPARPSKTIQDTCYHALTAGRWLKQHHSEVTDPCQWDERVATEYVTYTCSAYRGDQTRPSHVRHFEYQRNRQRLSPRGINSRLRGMRAFFTQLQRQGYTVDGTYYPKLQVTWLPSEVFKTPGHVRDACQPNPRDIHEDTWIKLVWAACSLTGEQLHTVLRIPQYPLAYYRAACLLWVTAARRSDEIRRLSVGCVRREWAPEMRDEHDVVLEPSTEVCYLRVPTNKMRGEFFVPIPAYAAEAVEVWERLRPPNQDPIEDRKTRKPTHYLFQFRNELMGKGFLNESVIPLLCGLAGVGQTDATGRITAHRARATTATWMRKMGMSPMDIGRLLGHTDPARSLPWYLREDLHRLGRVYRKANPLDRYVAAVMDVEAQARGEPCVFYYLADDPEGRPRMCGNPHFSRCVHQMACIECAAFIDHELAATIERRDGVLRIAVPVPLPPQLATDESDLDDVRVHTTGLPPPPLPGPAFHFNMRIPRSAVDSGAAADPRERLRQLEEQVRAKQEAGTDRRSAALGALVREIALLRAQIGDAAARAGERQGDHTM